MPSRHRPKPPPPAPLSDIERFAQAVRESEEAKRRAKQAAKDRKAEAERRKAAAIEHAARLERVRHDHQRAVEQVKEAKRTGKGAAAADLAWRKAKAALIELETGEPPAWAVRADSHETSATADDHDSDDNVSMDDD